MRILAIDLGKNNSVACDYEAPSDQHGFISMATTPARLSDIITKVAPDRVKLLQSIPGVGPRLAEMVVSVIDDPHRFGTGKQLGCYVGLTPRQYQSGSMDRQGRISSQGHKNLRKLLVEVSWLGLRHNRRMREIYERVWRGSKVRKKIAIVAVARRLLIWCWAMLRDDQPWDAT